MPCCRALEHVNDIIEEQSDYDAYAFDYYATICIPCAANLWRSHSSTMRS